LNLESYLKVLTDQNHKYFISYFVPTSSVVHTICCCSIAYNNTTNATTNVTKTTKILMLWHNLGITQPSKGNSRYGKQKIYVGKKEHLADWYFSRKRNKTTSNAKWTPKKQVMSSRMIHDILHLTEWTIFHHVNFTTANLQVL